MKVTLNLPGYTVVCTGCLAGMIEDLQKGIQRKGTAYNAKTYHVEFWGEKQAQATQGPQGDQAGIQGDQQKGDQARDVDPGPFKAAPEKEVRGQCDHANGRCCFEQFGGSIPNKG